MTKPINLYLLSRIHDEISFNAIKKHQSSSKEFQNTQFHEIESLRLLVNKLINAGASLSDLDGFFYSFQIPQIGKEFDLLRITDKICLNIELKSTSVPEEQIKNQLLKNRHYLNHLGKRISLFSIITDSMTCYKLSLNDELITIPFEDIFDAIINTSLSYISQIDNMFRPSDYLVSPLNTPDRFIQGEYFLTQAQEKIRKEILSQIDSSFSRLFIHLTGRPGTGKTLLLYDLAKTLSKNGKTLIIHCGKLSDGQNKIKREIAQLDIFSANWLRNDDIFLNDYQFILVDETHRIYPSQFIKICESVSKYNQICVFSTDPEQVLSESEKQNDIVNRIKNLPPDKEYVLSEKIRTNKELHSFIMRIQNQNIKNIDHFDYSSVDLYYANTTKEAQSMLEYYKANDYVFINYSKSNYVESPYSIYEEDFDTHHVIGQEFDYVVMLMDSSFYYDEYGKLHGIPHPNPDYLYPNLFYQGVTRVRERLAIIVVNAPELFSKMTTLLN